MQAHFYQRLIQVFAIVASSSSDRLGDEAKAYITRVLLPLPRGDRNQGIIKDFESELERFNARLSQKRISSNSVKLMRFAQELNEDLPVSERRLLLIRVTEFATGLPGDNSQVFEYISLLADMMELPAEDFQLILSVCAPDSSDPCFFTFDEQEIYYRITDRNNLKNPGRFQSGMIFPFYPSDHMDLKGGETIDFAGARVLAGCSSPDFDLEIKNLNFVLPGGAQFFYGLNLILRSPGMVAVLGPSGAGKSSFLKLIAGVLKPDDGEISCNMPGLNVSMMPQEDNIAAERGLISQLEEINLKYGLKKTRKELDDLLFSLDLSEKAEVVPGNVANSNLSGGERKRAGLACALMTDPDLLLCDEPSSGLSSQDAEILVSGLRRIATRGCLIVATLHQPEMSLLRYFDRILYIDEGGSPVYFGYPDGFFTAVSVKTGRKQPDSGLMENLHNDLSRTEAIIRLRDEKGKRRYPPEFWRKFFQEQPEETKVGMVALKYNRRPLRIFPAFIQDIKNVFLRRSFALMSFLYAPLMAVLLSVVCRFSPGEGYTGTQNIHLPVFFLMTIVVAVFGGLVFSVSEIGRQQEQRKREILTEGNNRRYFWVKLMRFGAFSAFHALIFSFLSLLILDLPYLLWPLSLIYFLLMLLSSFAGMLLSVLARGKSWAFIVVPVLIIPQLIFSGGLIQWADFPGWERPDKAPFVSRLMPSSYAFEAMMTESIVRNPGFSMENERVHYLSLVFLQEILPVYEQKLQAGDSALASGILIRTLPGELSEAYDNTYDTDKLKRIFRNNLDETPGISRDLPVVWRYLQNYDRQTSVDCSKKGRLYSGEYAFYQTGKWRHDKSARIELWGWEMSHFQMSLLFLLLMCLPLLLVLYFFPFAWPY